MTLIVMTVIVIAVMIAAVAIYLFIIGGLLSRTAGNLGDCLQSLRTVAGQADAIRPGIQRINQTGGELLDALPLLIEDVDGVTAKLIPSANTAETAPAVAVTSPATASAPANSSTTTQANVGYMDLAPDPDPTPTKGGKGYIDS